MCFSVGCQGWPDATSLKDHLRLTSFVSIGAKFGGILQCEFVVFSVLESSLSSSQRTIGFHRGLAVAAAGDDGAPRLRSLGLSSCAILAVHRYHSHVCRARDLAARQELFLRVDAQGSAGRHPPSCPIVFGS